MTFSRNTLMEIPGVEVVGSAVIVTAEMNGEVTREKIGYLEPKFSQDGVLQILEGKEHWLEWLEKNDPRASVVNEEVESKPKKRGRPKKVKEEVELPEATMNIFEVDE